ncbi:MAG: DEAD/DEAH box helicase [Candidatus Cloacimonetes bacterium]|jgi:SNF2 family DNA or RNA helicase|nr:DEAD/DEAH box helicase [Candidatus Cloacimonadota bacterium]
MLVLHISLYQGAPFLWSEGKRIGHLPDLKKAIKALGLGDSFVRPKTQKVIAWLPAKAGKHYPSTSLIGDPPSGKAQPKLQPFACTALELNFSSLVDIVQLSKEGNIPDSGVLFSHSFHWFAGLVALAFNLVSEQSYLPGIIQEEETYYAFWLPVLSDTSKHDFRALYRSVPHSVSCMSNSSAVVPTAPNPSLIGGQLDNLVDSAIRMAAEPGHVFKAVSVHDAWLNALYAKDRRIIWPKQSELTSFATELAAWSHKIYLMSASDYKMSFRLCEPTTTDKWKLQILLHPKADPSLLIPAAKFFKPSQALQKDLKPFGLPSPEWIMNALGQATGIFPALRKSWTVRKQSDLELDTDLAFSFLHTYAGALNLAGFNVLLPTWWIKRNTQAKLGIKLSTRKSTSQSSGLLNMESILAFDFSACLGDEELSLSELKAMAKLKNPLVKVRGQWINIDIAQLNAAINFLDKQQKKELSAKDMIQLALGAESGIKGFEIQKVEYQDWMQKLLRVLSGKEKPARLPQPKLFKGILREYQQLGFSWLAYLRKWGFGACLADDMGLGKTIQALALIQTDKDKGQKLPVLLVCPTTVVNNWRKESERFTPNLKVLIHHGSDRLKKTAFTKAAAKADIVISSFGLIHRDLGFLGQVKWAGIIIDEAQNIKNPDTLQSKAARSIKAEYRIALTGTPVENHATELWAIMDFLNPGYLGNLNSFRENYHRPIHIRNDKAAAEKLQRITAPFILRRLKTDKSIIADLPDKIEMKEYCPLTKEQISLYQAVADDLQDKISSSEGIERKGLILSAILRLKQVCNHPAQFAGDNSPLPGRSGKLQRLLEITTEVMANKERILIFTQFAQMGAILQQALQEYFGTEVLFLHGSLSKGKRDKLVERFQGEGDAPSIFVLSLKAGGTGLNLTNANHVIHYDRWWNPAVENQATDRAFRIGQVKNVQVHKFIVSGTLEEKIDELIERKQLLNEKLVGAGENWLSKLNDNDFRELIRLSDNVSGD